MWWWGEEDLNAVGGMQGEMELGAIGLRIV